MTLVRIDWLDAHDDAEQWTDPADIDQQPRTVTTVGTLLQYGQGGKRRHMSVALSVDSEGFLGKIIHVPRQCVIRVAILAESLVVPLEPNG